MAGRGSYYDVLGVAPDATAGQIRSAFRRLARRWHPDANDGSDEAERTFKRISRAYDTLGDAERRAAYDRRRHGAVFETPGGGERPIVEADDGRRYHTDMGHHSDFYQAGDPLSVADAAALTGRHPDVLRAAIRDGRLPAMRDGRAWLLRRRDVERLDARMAKRTRTASGAEADA